MAYSRYSRVSDWYIFAKVALGEEETVLAVWHKDFRKGAPEFALSEVRIMLELSDFSRVPGFSSEAMALLRAAFEQFIADEESESAPDDA